MIIGMIFFCYQQSWIMISFPTTITQYQTNNQVQQSIKPKTVSLWIWKHNKWISETSEILYSNNMSQNIQLLLNNWFQLLEDEQITDKQTIVESVALTKTGHEAFISFNQNPLNAQASTYQTCMFIEGILKTLHNNNTPIKTIRFLVHHQPLLDDRLNFNISWPIEGYIKS